MRRLEVKLLSRVLSEINFHAECATESPWKPTISFFSLIVCENIEFDFAAFSFFTLSLQSPCLILSLTLLFLSFSSFFLLSLFSFLLLYSVFKLFLSLSSLFFSSSFLFLSPSLVLLLSFLGLLLQLNLDLL